LRLIKYIMGVTEFALSRIGLGVGGQERVRSVEPSEFAHFGSFGDFGLVELALDGGVYLNVDQLRLFKERDGMKGCFVERQKDGRYLLNVRK